jgi:hypothetical protein
MNESTISLDEALAHTRTGDIWLFRGRSAADAAIRVATNAPVNHVGMAVVLEDLPPLMWHAELGRSLEDVWTGEHQRGVQLHNLFEAVRTWHDKYNQVAWLRQLDVEITPEMEDAVLKTIARLDGTPFPTAPKLASSWIKGRTRSRASLETMFCAQVAATTYAQMGLIDTSERPENYYDPGSFWSGDGLELAGDARLSPEIRVKIPPLTGEGDADSEEGARRRKEAARQWWSENSSRVKDLRAGDRLLAAAGAGRESLRSAAEVGQQSLRAAAEAGQQSLRTAAEVSQQSLRAAAEANRDATLRDYGVSEPASEQEAAEEPGVAAPREGG